MSQLHLFNPGHEMEILGGQSHYTLPYTIQKMASDLELLPVWYGGSRSFTLVRNTRATFFITSLPKVLRSSLSSPMVFSMMTKELYKRRKAGQKAKLPPITAAMWGISPRAIELLKNLKQGGMNIDIPKWKDEYTQLTKRQTAAECLSRLQDKFPITPPVQIPHFCTDIAGLETYMANNTPPHILKMPLSSSGRGLYWLKDNQLSAHAQLWINGAFKKQEAISIEPALDKVMDFAAEYYADKDGKVKYVGASIFETQSDGRFIGCMLGSQHTLMQLIYEYISQGEYAKLVEQVRQTLEEVLGGAYAGYMGVDMLVYKNKDNSYAIHPFVELNLRYTIGLLAMQFSHRFVHNNSQGLLRITYHVNNALKEHERMQSLSPLKIEKNKIRSGYMSLCPVTHDTNFMAVVDIF